jgi:hypothetical protein
MNAQHLKSSGLLVIALCCVVWVPVQPQYAVSTVTGCQLKFSSLFFFFTMSNVLLQVTSYGTAVYKLELQKLYCRE